MRRINWLLLGVGIGWAITSLVGFVVEDISRGQRGYDSIYYRHYTVYTSPMTTEALVRIRNLAIGDRAWIRSGAGCEYLVEHAYDAKWQHHLGKVLEARSRWGLPCHEASWWRAGSIIADGEPGECVGGQWRATRERSGGGWRLNWTCDGRVANER